MKVQTIILYVLLFITYNLQAVTVSNDTTICEGDTITIYATGGVTYQWDNGLGTGASHNISPITNTSYSVTVTYSGGNDTTLLVKIFVNPKPNPEITGPTQLCRGVTARYSIIQTFNTYLWSNNGTTQFSDYNDVSEVTITVTNTYGCEGIDTFLVNIFNPNAPIIVGDTSFCNGDSTTLTVIPSYSSYLWSNTAIDSSIVVNTSGTYYVTVEDEFGCTDTAQISVLEFPIINANIQGQNSFCEGASTSLTINNLNVNLQWSTGETTQSILVTEATTYFVTITDTNSCSVIDSIQVEENQPTDVIISQDKTLCTDSVVTLFLNQEFSSYLWSTSETTDTILINQQGEYSITVTDANGCESSDTIIIAEYSNTNPQIIGDSIKCINDTIPLSLSEEYVSYLWSIGEETESIWITEADIYSVFVTDTNGCGAYDTIVVNQYPNLTFKISGGNIPCGLDSRILTASSGFFNNVWSTSDTTHTIIINGEGNYSISATDTNNCIYTDNIDVVKKENPILDIEYDSVLCPNDSTLIKVLTTNVSYLWYTGNTTNYIMVDSSGYYGVTITTEYGCTSSANIKVVKVDSTVYSINSIPTSCPNTTDGLIKATATSEYAPFTYEWSNQDTLFFADTLGEGYYSLTITDSLGCKLKIDSIYVPANEGFDCLFIPNAFSPNGDGYNDTWEIVNIDMFDEVKIEVFNRWGQSVYLYENTGENYTVPMVQWNGTYNFTDYEYTTYFYVIDLKNGREPLTGSVTVKK